MGASIQTRDMGAGAAGVNTYVPAGDVFGLSAATGGMADLSSVIQAVTVVRRAELNEAHWEVFFACNGTLLKVDLTALSYRVLYGAQLPPNPNNMLTYVQVRLRVPQTLGTMLRAVSDVAEEQGVWTGTDQYNCQDFAIQLMLKLRGTRKDIFPLELRRAVTKRNARLGLPGIGDGM